MIKEELKRIISKNIYGLGAEVSLERLVKIRELTNDIIKEMSEDILKDQIYCKYCKKYYPADDCYDKTEKISTVETTYTDCGYGDDDMIGEVLYLVEYKVCPKCHKNEVKRHYIKTLWEKRRGE